MQRTSVEPAHVFQLQQASVLVLGDVMLDCYLSGSVSRVSPEAPVPVLHAGDERTVLGGAANVAANVVALGGKAVLAGIYGADARGAQLEQLCAEAGVQLSPLLRRPDAPTIVKQRVVSGSQQLLRIDYEAHATVTASEAAEFRAWVRSVLVEESISVVVLSDYAKGTLAPDVCAAVITEARAAGVPVVVDPKGTDLTPYAGADVVKPNLAEASTLARVGPGAEPAAMAAAIHQHAEIGTLVISLASAGVGIFPADGEPDFLKSHVVEVADVSGAGDTMVAAIAAGLGSGLALRQAVDLGNVAAGVACTHFGTFVVSAGELLRGITTTIGSAQSPHVVRDWATLRELVEARRRAGERIVFANGCFDLLHGGHVALLEEARRQGDVLVIGLNSDESVQRLKGPTRPLQPIEDRMRVMAAVRFVDYVTAFEQDTPLELVLALRPDVLVKGGDYAPESVVGGAEAKAWGGRVHIAQLVDGVSTTRLVSAGAS